MAVVVSVMFVLLMWEVREIVLFLLPEMKC
jgi:hypothetical protein